MNTAEKIAATYLRLNGFLLLPHFTIFEQTGPRHIDLIGLRGPGSKEQSIDPEGNSLDLLVDDKLFATFEKVVATPKNALLGVVGEVKTNDYYERPTSQQFEYVRKFIGTAHAIRMAFYYDGIPNPMWHERDQTVLIGPDYALGWILDRFDWMQNKMKGRTKEGSWNWSEQFLADLLVLRKFGKLKN